VVVPTSVEPTYSRNLSLSGFPPVSARAQRVAVYVPADVDATQFGESLRRQVPFVDAPFATRADQLPECPPATRVRVTPVPEPEVFQPERSFSKPGLRTKLTASEAVLVLPASFPVTVWGPPALGVQTFALQEPSGESENAVAAVTSPVELPNVSKPCAL
jgi:hypothetical protein